MFAIIFMVFQKLYVLLELFMRVQFNFMCPVISYTLLELFVWFYVNNYVCTDEMIYEISHIWNCGCEIK